jgi:hypothetical protein
VDLGGDTGGGVDGIWAMCSGNCIGQGGGLLGFVGWGVVVGSKTERDRVNGHVVVEVNTSRVVALHVRWPIKWGMVTIQGWDIPARKIPSSAVLQWLEFQFYRETFKSAWGTPQESDL